MRHLIAALALALAACANEPADWEVTQKRLFPDAFAPVVLSGTITRADHQTYREISFFVPQGMQRITIDFSYDKDNRTVIDLGLRDPQGQRGWSGGNKSRIEIGPFTATPSYRPAPIQAGEWKLVLGIPNIRDGQTSSYSATITFDGQSDQEREPYDHDFFFPNLPQPSQPRSSSWFRGDFHSHTAHSDGSCDVDGERQPCPTHHTADAARNAGLDFVAVTDHNTITQLADLRRLQSNYPNTLLIPGTEITTFNGHANVVGNLDFLDFQLGSPRLPTLAKLFDQVDAANAFISINHPSLPSGEVCMGCGWTVKDTDWSRVSAIEVINGSTLRTTGAEGPLAGIAFWEKRLNEGHRITAIGGSDNHDATDVTGARQSPIGKPATVVYANNLSTEAVIAGVKSGRVFVDATGFPEATLDMHATAGGQTAHMGGEIALRPGEEGRLTISTSSLPDGASIEVIRSPGVTDVMVVGRPYRGIWLQDGVAHGWVRINIRDAAGKLLLLGNPIYFRRAG